MESTLASTGFADVTLALPTNTEWELATVQGQPLIIRGVMAWTHLAQSRQP